MQVTRFIHKNSVYFFAGILLLSILVFGAQYLLRVTSGGIGDGTLYILSVRAFLFIFFVGFLALALINKHRPDTHARWMICSAAVLLDPILSRVSAFLHPVPWTTGVHQLAAFAIMNLIIFLLAVADWRQGRRDVFPAALVSMVMGQTAALTLWDTSAFHSFAGWFATLPLPLGH